MKESLLKKTNYLLNFKLNHQDARYQKLLEKIFYEFIESIETTYNRRIPKDDFYNKILNKLNKSIKAIIIPSDTFRYHPSGFLEFGTNLSSQLARYKSKGISITKELKEEILRKKYFYYILQVLKTSEKGMGFVLLNSYNTFLEIEKDLTECQATTLAKSQKYYKKEYQTIYPDGTCYHYFLYTKCLGSVNTLNLNAGFMVEALFDKGSLFLAEMDNNVGILKRFDEVYEHLLGKLRYDRYGNVVYTPTTVINEFLKRIRTETSTYKQIEYFKKLNRFLLEIFDYKVTVILNQKKDQQIPMLLEQLKIFECNSIYNFDNTLNATMEHVRLLKRIKNKLNNYAEQPVQKAERAYTVYSLDRRKKETVNSSVEPIQVENQYVLLHILEVRSMNHRVLVKMNVNVLDMSSLTTKIYNDIYVSVKELRHLYSSGDLKMVSRSSGVIRSSIANRAYNPNIMDIIKKERNNFLGEFIYSEEEDRCIIYKNKSIEEALKKGI